MNNNITDSIQPQKSSQNTLSVIGQKGNTLIIVVLIFLMAIVGAGAYYLKTTKSAKPAQAPQPTQTSQPLPTTSSQDETASWKTFIGKSFTFKYPVELKIPNEAIETKSEGFIISTDDKDEYLSISTARTEIVKTGINQSVEEKKEWAKKYVGYWGSSYQGTTIIGGLEALVFATDKPRMPDIPQNVNLPPYKLYIVFSNSELNGKRAVREVKIEYFASAKNKKIFDQILSTFKFQ